MSQIFLEDNKKIRQAPRYISANFCLCLPGGRQGDLSESRVLVNTATNKTTAMIE